MLQKAVTEMKANPAAAIAKFNKADGGSEIVTFTYSVSKWGVAK
jgi:hypothetical protein